MISFAGISSDTVNVIVERYPSRPVPARRYTIQTIPGRSGDLLFDEDAFDNYVQEYEVYVNHNNASWQESMRMAAGWMSAKGYQVLYDDYDPDTFRMAYFEGPADFTNALNQLGRATIQFNCKPWRYLNSGVVVTTLNANGSITNPTDFNSLPLIKVTGTGAGVIGIGSYTVTISSIYTGMIIDCELLDCYEGANNRNSELTLSPQFEYPQLVPGANAITISGGVSSIEITPRWRCL